MGECRLCVVFHDFNNKNRAVHELCFSNIANLVGAQTIVSIRQYRVAAVISGEIVGLRNIFVNI